jgi:Putative prokaryotic signal transducing protein
MDHAPDPRLRPEYAQGELVAVTTVRNPAEAEMLRDMLLDEGIPSMVRMARSSNPFEMAGGAPHDVLVRESGYEAAYELVHGHPPEPVPPTSRSGPEPGNLLAVVLIVLGLIALVVWLSGAL